MVSAVGHDGATRRSVVVVVVSYNYNREDEEVYKEFLEIANERIPHMVRVAGGETGGGGVKAGVPLLSDPASYALLLHFFDGICLWEEDSRTPVLHIGWAKNLVFALGKFHGPARQRARVTAEGEEADEEKEREEREEREQEKGELSDPGANVENVEPRKRGRPPTKTAVGRPPLKKPCFDAARLSDGGVSNGVGGAAAQVDTNGNGASLDRNATSQATAAAATVADESEEQIQSEMEELASRVATGASTSARNDSPNLSMVALAHACGESILNPAYLLGIGEPFAAGAGGGGAAATPEPRANGGAAAPPFDSPAATCPDLSPQVVLRSAKMRGLRSLLLAGKLNASAIKLQLTAQSQVHLKHSGAPECPAKRTRR